MDSIFEEAKHLADTNNGVVFDRLMRRISKQISRGGHSLPPTCDFRKTRKKIHQKHRRIDSFAEKRELSFDQAINRMLDGLYANTFLPIVVRRYLYHKGKLPLLTACGQCLSCRVHNHGLGNYCGPYYSPRKATEENKRLMKSINSTIATEPDLKAVFQELVSDTIQEGIKVNCG